jgi:polyisoprenoid-binding protein YceI
MTRRILCGLLAWSVFNVSALAGGIQSDKSDIRFLSRQMGVEIEGRFKHFDGDVVFKPNDLGNSHAKIEVDLSSIDIGSPESEQEARGKDWFQVNSFPKGVFQSTSIRARTADQYEVVGKFTLKGITRDLTIPVTVKGHNGQRVADGSFVLKRTDFKIGQGAWADPDVVAVDVTVKFHLVLN